MTHPVSRKEAPTINKTDFNRFLFILSIKCVERLFIQTDFSVVLYDSTHLH
jgi:hypothetical protein